MSECFPPLISPLFFNKSILAWLFLHQIYRLWLVTCLLCIVWDLGTVIFQPAGVVKPWDVFVCLTSAFPTPPPYYDEQWLAPVPKTPHPQGQQCIVGDLITGSGSCRRRQLVLLWRLWHFQKDWCLRRINIRTKPKVLESSIKRGRKC